MMEGLVLLLGAIGSLELPAAWSANDADWEEASSSSQTSLALRPGERVNDYLLLSRVRSVPSTFAPSAELAPVETGLEVRGRVPAASYLVPELLDGTQPLALAIVKGEQQKEQLALVEGEQKENATGADAPSVRPLGLPSPYEAELALASASSTFRLHRRVQRGSHGEVWRAVRADDPKGTPLVLKRLTLERGGAATLRSGLRERHFGRKFRGHSDRIARYVDTFEEMGSLWLVFRDEGISLHDLVYTTSNEDDEARGEANERSGGSDGSGGSSSFVTMRPSHAWLQLREQPGHCTLRHIVRQATEGVAAMHASSVTHRDLKPANTIIQAAGVAAASSRSDPATGEGEGDSEGGGDGEAGVGDAGVSTGVTDRRAPLPLPSVRLADLGSAVDAEVLQPHVGLYPESGPSVAEETEGYQPPEASLGHEPFDASRPAAYDLWSLGVMIIELLLGTPHVLQLSNRAEAALRIRFADQPPAVLRKLLLANALAEHCILPPPAEATRSGDTTSTAAAAATEVVAEAVTEPSVSAVKAPAAEAAEVVKAVEAGGAPAAVVAGSPPSSGPHGGSEEDESGAHGGRSRRALPGSGPQPACGKEEFAAAIASRDPLAKLRVPIDDDLVDLAWRLLKWAPAERMSAAEALLHPALAKQHPAAASSTSWWGSPRAALRSAIRKLISPPETTESSTPAADVGAQSCEAPREWPE